MKNRFELIKQKQMQMEKNIATQKVRGICRFANDLADPGLPGGSLVFFPE